MLCRLGYQIAWHPRPVRLSLPAHLVGDRRAVACRDGRTRRRTSASVRRPCRPHASAHHPGPKPGGTSGCGSSGRASEAGATAGSPDSVHRGAAARERMARGSGTGAARIGHGHGGAGGAGCVGEDPEVPDLRLPDGPGTEGPEAPADAPAASVRRPPELTRKLAEEMWAKEPGLTQVEVARRLSISDRQLRYVMNAAT